ncbi:MAG: hypothetical protein OXC62_03000 [Aestuariivita sp.]|nr:hypothetical protein [Aestuariivita sp.]
MEKIKRNETILSYMTLGKSERDLQTNQISDLCLARPKACVDPALEEALRVLYYLLETKRDD